MSGSRDEILATGNVSARDFDEADRLRAEIEAAGWEARDVADGFQLVPK